MSKARAAIKISSPKIFLRGAEKAAAQERAIQRRIDQAERRLKGKSKKSGPVQAGARKYPGPPLPKQHLPKPGLEAELKLKPMYDAPYYKGSEKLSTWSR